jgi:putative ABC transport system permease protein
VRTLLGMIAISIQVTMVLTLVGLSDGMLNEQASRARGVGADILIRPPGGAIIASGGQMLEKIIPVVIDKEPHVTAATGTLIFGTDLFNYITGVDLATFNQLNGGFRFVDGGPFQHPDDIMVDDVYASQHKLHVGDSLNNTNHMWRVSGIYVPGMLARLVVPLDTLQNLTGNTGKVSTVYVKVDQDANIPGVIFELSDKLKTYKVYSMEDYTSLFSASNVPMLTDFIWVVVGVGVLVGFLVVFLSMYTAVLDRTREIGVLKMPGGSPG